MGKTSESSLKENNIIDQIQKDNAYYRSIIENNSFYIIKTDLQGNYTYMNPFFSKMLGINPEDYLGKESLSLILPEDHEICKDTVAKCFATPNTSHWVNLRKPYGKGALSTQWEFKLVLDESGKPLEILCVGHDITPLILKQEELQNLVDVTSGQNKRLINFTYIISHNVRSHVANIIGIVDIGEIAENEEENKLMWNLIKESADSLDETLYNLNEVVSIQSNTNLPVNPINVHHEIVKIVKSIQIMVNQADTSINYNFEYDEIIESNPAYFESIVLNLITNSLKYRCPDRPLTIDINLFREDNYTVMTFRDNGLGIDIDKYKEELFGMYKIFHGNKDARGLGLFIIKTQIEAMKGKIEVESEVGKSTTFKLYFANR